VTVVGGVYLLFGLGEENLALLFRVVSKKDRSISIAREEC